MAKVGDKIFAYTPEGIEQAEEYAKETGEEVEYAPGGMSNARDRSIKEYAGGGMVGFDSIGNFPGTLGQGASPIRPIPQLPPPPNPLSSSGLGNLAFKKGGKVKKPKAKE